MKIILMAMIITALVSLFFIFSNPILFENMDYDFSDGEVFKAQENHFDFGLFSLNSTQHNFTAKVVESGFIQLVGENDKYIINVIQKDKMFDFKASEINDELKGEFELENQSVDGVTIYKEEYMMDSSYSAYINSSDFELYISTPDINETVMMAKSFE